MTRIEPSKRTRWVGYACAGLVVVLWAGFSLAGRYASLTPGVRLTPWDLLGLRYLVAAPIAMVAFVAGPGGGVPWRRRLVVAALAGLCFPIPVFIGFGYAPTAHAAVITSGCMPFFVTTGLIMIGAEHWTRTRLASLSVLLLGIALLGITAFVQGGQPGAWRGDLLFTVGAIAWAAFTILARRWALTPWQVVSTVGIVAGLPFLAAWALWLPSHLSQVSIGASVFQAVVQGLLVTVVSVLLFTRALMLIGPERVSLITALVPGVAGALSVPLLGETIGLLDTAGLVLVTGAVVLGIRRSQSE